MGYLMKLILIAALCQFGLAENFECYSDICSRGRNCKEATGEFTSADMKKDCQNGCVYERLLDAEGDRAEEWYKKRGCWNNEADSSEDVKNKDGTCIDEKTKEGNTHRTCFCAKDFCNSPMFDDKFENYSSAIKFQNSFVPILLSLVCLHLFT